MLKSGDIKYLRADVRANCLIFLDLCKQAGLPAKVTDTVRDDEYQRYLVSKGYAHKDAMRPTFHSAKAGLAFDICKDVAGHGYDDASFFARCGQMMDSYLAQLGTKPVSTWAAKDWAAAKAAGITDGSAPQRLITRQEVVTMIQRATK